MTQRINTLTEPANSVTEADASNATQPIVSTKKPQHVAQNAIAPKNDTPSNRPTEFGGQTGLEPTRYGDWEKKGRCTDF